MSHDESPSPYEMWAESEDCRYDLDTGLYLAGKEAHPDGLELRKYATSWVSLLRGLIQGGHGNILVKLLKERRENKGKACELCVSENNCDMLIFILAYVDPGELYPALVKAAHANNTEALTILLDQGVRPTPDLGRDLARNGRLESLKVLIEYECFIKSTRRTMIREAQRHDRHDVVVYLTNLL